MFRLAFRQAEGLIGSIVGLLGLGLRVPDHTTLSRRAATLEVPRPGNASAAADPEPLHLLVDSTGLKLRGKGEWLLEKHGTATRRWWRALHFGVAARTGRIVGATLTSKDVDGGAEVGPLLDQVPGPVAPFTDDGAYDQDRVSAAVAERHSAAAIIVPPRSTAVPSETAATAPTQRDRHLQCTAEQERAAWQKASDYTKRARAEAAVGRPAFHDTKDLRFGLGLSATRVSEPTRRDRLLLVSAFAMALLSLLGVTGESLGVDRLLKSNTSKARTHSLFRQGCMLHDLIANMPEHRRSS